MAKKEIDYSKLTDKELLDITDFRIARPIPYKAVEEVKKRNLQEFTNKDITTADIDGDFNK